MSKMSREQKMIEMDKKEQIIHYHRIDGLSSLEIAYRVGVSKKTVKCYITDYETLAQADSDEGGHVSC